MKTPHPHAAAMMLYAEDAAETTTPWERWVCKHKKETSWRDEFEEHPAWDVDYEYRRKPQTITVNGIEVPEPIRKAPGNTEPYYLAYPTSEDLFNKYYWTGAKTEKLRLEKGLLHSTREAAIAHAKAMLVPSQRNQSEY